MHALVCTHLFARTHVGFEPVSYLFVDAAQGAQQFFKIAIVIKQLERRVHEFVRVRWQNFGRQSMCFGLSEAVGLEARCIVDADLRWDALASIEKNTHRQAAVAAAAA